MKNIISGSFIALLLMTASPASAQVGGTITRQAPVQATINTLIVKVLEMVTWKSNIGSLTFSKGGFSATAGCNNIFGSYTVDGTTINFGEPASTLMYCEDKMENEAALITTLDTATNITFKDGKLVLSHGTSSTSFTPTLATTSSNSKKLFISSETKSCDAGVAEMDCMQVKYDDKQTNWENFYADIEGFTYEKGHEYEIIVSTEKIANPPADASSIKYTLVKVVSKK